MSGSRRPATSKGRACGCRWRRCSRSLLACCWACVEAPARGLIPVAHAGPLSATSKPCGRPPKTGAATAGDQRALAGTEEDLVSLSSSVDRGLRLSPCQGIKNLTVKAHELCSQPLTHHPMTTTTKTTLTTTTKTTPTTPTTTTNTTPTTPTSTPRRPAAALWQPAAPASPAGAGGPAKAAEKKAPAPRKARNERRRSPGATGSAAPRLRRYCRRCTCRRRAPRAPGGVSRWLSTSPTTHVRVALPARGTGRGAARIPTSSRCSTPVATSARASTSSCIAGSSCAEILREDGWIELAEALSIIEQACEGLDYAHRHGVVHRDVKPGNLLRAREGQVKLADFGIAKATEQSSITQVGSVLGTAAYLAPEQARGEEAGPSADLYALGVVAYQLISGRLPYEATSLTELALKQQQEHPATLDTLVASVCHELADAVDRAGARPA